MAEKFFEYKGKPLVRSGNTVYYGDINDPYVVCLTIKNSEDYKDITLAGDITIQLLATDESLPPKDRIVKKKFNKFCEGCICPPEFPVCVCGRKPRGKLPFKSKAPTENEVGENFRAQSARLRAIEKI